VFHDAVSKKEMIPLKDFLGAQTSIYKSSWVPSPWGVLQWGLRTIGVLGQPGFGDRLEAGTFVVLSNVEAAAKEVLQQIGATSFAVDMILSRKEFLKRYATVLNPAAPLTSNDLNILLLHLARDRQVISYDKQTIKFKPDNEAFPLPITQEDTAISQLRDTITKINAQLEPLSEKISAFDTAAREAVKSKQMIRAKAALRSKKLAESALAQRTDVALQLEGVYAKLQEATDQIEIVEAMSMSAVALKGLNKKVGGVERVEGVVDALREEMSTADEIANVINEASEPVDEGEIDDEFEELARAEREKKEAIEQAEREKREAEEAAKTAARLAELEVLEKERREKEAEKERQITKEAEVAKQKEKKESEEYKEDLDMSESLARLSFMEEPKADAKAEKVPEAA
jgi:charged multivesicular body protein 7